MPTYVLMIVFEHEEISLPDLDTEMGIKILVEKKLPDNIIDYKILATEK